MRVERSKVVEIARIFIKVSFLGIFLALIYYSCKCRFEILKK
jgi:hypothetical protein